MDTPKWNRDNILMWILERDSKKMPVRAKDAKAYSNYMYRQAVRAFGSWTVALATAGIKLRTKRGKRRWSPHKVIRAIQRASVKPESLCYTNMQKRSRSLHDAARNFFGSWRKALITAGIDPESVRLKRSWDRESLIEAILDRAVKNKPLSVTKVSPKSLGTWGVRLFGSWREALCAAGLDPDQYIRVRLPIGSRDASSRGGASPFSTTQPRKWSKDRIASELHRRVREGKAINPVCLKIEERYIHSAIRRHFDSWCAALIYAGLDPEKFSKRRCKLTKKAPQVRQR